MCPWSVWSIFSGVSGAIYLCVRVEMCCVCEYILWVTMRCVHGSIFVCEGGKVLSMFVCSILCVELFLCVSAGKALCVFVCQWGVWVFCVCVELYLCVSVGKEVCFCVSVVCGYFVCVWSYICV